MAEGLTDKMRCQRCGARWDQRGDSESLRHCPDPSDHVWVVPVEAVTQAIDAEVERILNGDDDAFVRVIVAQKPALGDGAIGTARAAIQEVARQFRALFSPFEEGQTE